MKAHTINDIETQIFETRVAKEVVAARFEQGDEDEIRTTFYRLWGEVIRMVHNRADTSRTYYFVKGDAREMFDAHYA